MYDCGGCIWVEDVLGEYYVDMVGGVLVEYLVDFFGMVVEFVVCLIEEY